LRDEQAAVYKQAALQSIQISIGICSDPATIVKTFSTFRIHVYIGIMCTIGRAGV